MTIEYWQLPILFAVGLVAGFVDSIAGGGGLIALPTLLSCGLEPKFALGTSRFQGMFGSGSAAWHYTHGGAVNFRECARGFFLAALGAGIGTLTVQQLDPSFLRRFLPIMLGAVAVYSLLRPAMGEQDHPPRMSRGMFDMTFVFFIAMYDGFFGPGSGMFWTIAFVTVMGFNLTRATAQTKIMNFGSNMCSVAFFMSKGQVVFPAGLAMGAGQLLGARIGSRMVIKRGAKFIRPVFITAVLALTAKLLYDAYLK